MITAPSPGTSTSEFKLTLTAILAHVGVVVATWINPSGVLAAGQQVAVTKIAAGLATALVGLYATHRTWLKAQIAKAEVGAAPWVKTPLAAPIESADAQIAPSATSTTGGATTSGYLVVGAPLFNPADHLDPAPTGASPAA